MHTNDGIGMKKRMEITRCNGGGGKHGLIKTNLPCVVEQGGPEHGTKRHGGCFTERGLAGRGYDDPYPSTLCGYSTFLDSSHRHGPFPIEDALPNTHTCQVRWKGGEEMGRSLLGFLAAQCSPSVVLV
ncbi:hypothetical protein F5X98DRAFT_257693 [Xylaria grammica]|nr:hypothetical protein F5X98DRAFT_257693 [Xylaria grammica]